jgi:hypothetical protein
MKDPKKSQMIHSFLRLTAVGRRALGSPVKVNMPPKRTVSTSKRKESTSSSDEDAPKATKKQKVSASASRYSDQPTNKVLPVDISFPPKASNTLRFSTWNIAGLAASQKKGFKYYVQAEDPDILVLTETKVRVISRLFVFQPYLISGEQYTGGSCTKGTLPIRTLDNI